MQATQASPAARFSPSSTPGFITPSALHPGDVLLSCGTEALSILIRRLDGGDYSHSAVWDGAFAVDATSKGVKRRKLQDDMDVQWFMDAYRWHSPPPNGVDLGDPTYPYQPVITRNDRIVDAGTRFAYDELLMLAVIAAVSKEPSDKWTRRAVRLMLSRVEQWLHDHIFSKPGTEAMTCAETVAVSFDEAVPAKYAIEVEIDQSRHYDTLASARPLESGPGMMHRFSSYDDVRRRYAELVAAAAPAAARGLQVAIGARRGVRVKLPPGCVTPRDLQTSPSLRKIGRLSQHATPPAETEPTWKLFIDLAREYLHRPKHLSRL